MLLLKVDYDTVINNKRENRNYGNDRLDEMLYQFFHSDYDCCELMDDKQEFSDNNSLRNYADRIVKANNLPCKVFQKGGRVYLKKTARIQGENYGPH